MRPLRTVPDCRRTYEESPAPRKPPRTNPAITERCTVRRKRYKAHPEGYVLLLSLRRDRALVQWQDRAHSLRTTWIAVEALVLVRPAPEFPPPADPALHGPREFHEVLQAMEAAQRQGEEAV